MTPVTETKEYRSIASELIRSIYWWATACALAVSVMQAVYLYFHIHEEVAQELREIAETNIPMLSLAIWDIEPTAVRKQLDAIVQRREIGYVRVKVATGQEFSLGNASHANGRAPRHFDIPPPSGLGPPIGVMEIFENRDGFWRELGASVMIIVLGYGMLTLVVCALVAAILRRKLEQPLARIANFATDLSPSTLTTRLTLDRPAEHERDEIDLVVDAFGMLQDSLHDHIANLDQLVAERTRELEEALSSIRRLSAVDPLTGCLNRRSFDERSAQEIGRAERYERPLSLIFCDVDHFKSINDRYGHSVGDQVLRAASEALLEGLRSELDSLYRIGGEEFVILLPETGELDAVITAERLRQSLLLLTPAIGEPDLRITASFGVAQWQPGETADALVARADALLYKAKQLGRNRTCPAVGLVPVDPVESTWSAQPRGG